MSATRRTVGFGALAAAALSAAPRAALAYGGDAYSVSGKKGPYVKQVAGRTFGPGGGGAGGSLGLASDTGNLGRYQAARLRMPQTEARIAALLAKIDTQWPYAKGQPLQVHILGVDYYNAYSLADGSIVVAFGLLDQAQSDDEVAFVLAHELGHVRLGHFNRQPVAATRQSAVNSAAQFLVVSSALQAGGLSSSAVAAATQAGATTDLLKFMTTVMVEPEHTRAQEDEADCIGYDLSQAAAFSADSASAKVFDTIQADQQKRTAVVDTLNTQLKSQLSHAITSGQALSMLNGGDLRSGLLQGAGRLAIGVAAARASEAPPQHRPPEERKRGMAEYSAAAYPEGAPLRNEQKTWLTAVRATNEFAQAKLAVTAVSDTKRARADGHYDIARAAIQRARQTTLRNAPLVLNEAARLSDDMGDTASAERLYQQANASPDQTVDGYVDHVRMLFRTKQYDRALTVASEGVARFGNDDKPFISLRIAINHAEGRTDQVEADLAHCESYGNPDLTKDCQLAAGKNPKAASDRKQPSSVPNLPFGLPHF